MLVDLVFEVFGKGYVVKEKIKMFFRKRKIWSVCKFMFVSVSFFEIV